MSHSARVLSTADRLRKLRAMAPAEVMWRTRYKAVLQVERFRHRRGVRSPASRLESVLTPALRHHDWPSRLLAARMTGTVPRFFGIAGRDVMRSLFNSRYAPELAATLLHAGDARDHRFRFFGCDFTYGADIPWQDDPVSGRRWPAVFHADVPVHGGNVGFGDVKYVWELNRQQYLIDLGKAFFLTGDGESLSAVRDLVRSWMRGNPYGLGVNWSCALEPAFRALSWLWAYQLTREGLDDEFHLEWLRGFYEHAHFLDRHLEEYSSPYNHLIGEAAVLFMLGISFPEFVHAGRWTARARAVLEHRLDEQFYADGGSVEQSTFYHHATVGFYLLAALTGRNAGVDFSTRVWSAVERGLDFSMRLLQPDGRTPEIGGADDGKPIRLEHLPFWDFRPYLAIGAVLFRRGDFKFAATKFYEDAVWLLGPDGVAAFESIEAAPPRDVSSELPHSGYSILRSGWSNHADYVCVDCGEQAAGMRADAIANSMHGHADCLSVVAWLGGHRVLVDSGLYAYNCGGTWEAHFRETAAHNTARVDRRDQARHIGKMAWSHSYRAMREAFRVDSDQAWTLGSHDGFARGASPVTHRRAVWLREGSCLVICDEFTGLGEHDVDVNFQFAPGVLTPLSSHSAVFDQAVDVVWAGSGEWNADVSIGGPEPDAGWIAPSLGIRQAAPRLRLQAHEDCARLLLMTVLARRTTTSESAQVITLDGASGPVPLIAVQAEGWTDWIAAPGLAGGGPIESDALVAAVRVAAGRVVASDQIGGTTLHVDAAALTQVPAAR